MRERDETAAGTIDGALCVPLGRLSKSAAKLPRDRSIVAYCGHGERASTAVSILERAGFADVLNLDGGYDAWRAASH